MMKLSTKLPRLPDKLYIFRHGESIGNARGLDDTSLTNLANHQFPLTEKGREQSHQLAAYIHENDILSEIDEAYVSGFVRTQETLEIVLGGIEPEFPVYQDSRIDEWWKGIFHSMNADERELRYPAEKNILEREGWHHYRPPQGEAGKDVEARIQSFLAQLGCNALISGHGRVAGFLNRIICQEEQDLDCKYVIPGNCELWVFTREDNAYRRTSLFAPF